MTFTKVLLCLGDRGGGDGMQSSRFSLTGAECERSLDHLPPLLFLLLLALSCFTPSLSTCNKPRLEESPLSSLSEGFSPLLGFLSPRNRLKTVWEVSFTLTNYSQNHRVSGAPQSVHSTAPERSWIKLKKEGKNKTDSKSSIKF